MSVFNEVVFICCELSKDYDLWLGINFVQAKESIKLSTRDRHALTLEFTYH